MSVVPNRILNRAQIVFYSILIGFMTGVNHLRTQLDPYVDIPLQSTTATEGYATKLVDEIEGRPLAIYTSYLSQVIIRLFIWIILGFAAGFLIGMINSR